MKENLGIDYRGIEPKDTEEIRRRHLEELKKGNISGKDLDSEKIQVAKERLRLERAENLTNAENQSQRKVEITPEQASDILQRMEKKRKDYMDERNPESVINILIKLSDHKERDFLREKMIGEMQDYIESIPGKNEEIERKKKQLEAVIEYLKQRA